jgi:hypothetical protein
MRARSLVVALVMTACSGTGEEPSRAVASAIVGGATSGVEDDAVVQLLARSNGLTTVCSATAVAPQLVVTAAHCVSDVVPGNVRCTPAGELDPPDGPGRFLSRLEPSAIEIHLGSQPDRAAAAIGTKVLTTDTTTICRNDLAFVVLDRPLSKLAHVRLDGSITIGDRVSVVGYGVTEDPTRLGRHRVGDVRVEAVGPTRASDAASGALPRTFVLGPSVCGGDSGGPALNAGGAVVGVSSLTFGECTTPTVRNFFTSLPEFADLARRAFDAAGAKPLLESSGAPAEDSSSCSICRKANGPRVKARGSLAMVALALLTRRRSRMIR